MGGDGGFEGGVGGCGGKWGGMGGDLRVVITPHLHLSLFAGAGIFLMSRDAPHWLRVSVASFWKGGKL